MTGAGELDQLLQQWLRDGAKPRGAERIGVEVELFCFRRNTLAPVAYDGDTGLAALLHALAREPGWLPEHEGDLLVGLQQRGADGAASLSIEPGCQLEFSGAPLPSLHDVAAQLAHALQTITRAAQGLDVGLLPIGYHPLAAVADMPRSPQQRRKVMEAFLSRRGARAAETMYCTGSVQVNLDYHDEADFSTKLRVANALQPLATLLFAASPFRLGRANGLLSNRAACWRATDDARCGALPFAFAPGCGYADYIAYALARPMLALPGPGGTLQPAMAEMDLRSFCASRNLSAADSLSAWSVHNSFLYPQLRPRPYLELRGADCSPLALMGVAALWTGLLYDETALAGAEQAISGFTATDWQALSDMAVHGGLGGLGEPFRGRPVRELAERVLDLARGGLARRGRRSAAGRDETIYLDGLDRQLARGRSLAEDLVAAFCEADGVAAQPLHEALGIDAAIDLHHADIFMDVPGPAR